MAARFPFLRNPAAFLCDVTVTSVPYLAIPRRERNPPKRLVR